jgi:hypothetical protein
VNQPLGILFVDQTTSIIVPVHNVQQILKERICTLIEIFADLSECFEIRIVDDASTDATLEVATELSREYPQVRVTSRSKRRGLSKAASEEVADCMASTLLIHNVHEPIGLSALRELCGNGGNEGCESESIRKELAVGDRSVHRHPSTQANDRFDHSHQAGSFRLIARKKPEKSHRKFTSAPPLKWLETAADAIDPVPLS